ncbi:RHOMBOID-like protein 12, mitochondrial [Gastrolobium bilobum]|uniref:RHOMBOID-like protein 12, mitochondrial n=1 Tax=Gastrolobium bilobum TaxID=150636 RepID=UPI002AB20187|nr:RHOMBOID-like protein 12, mitochondrial [Gastrolobium bilobum]
MQSFLRKLVTHHHHRHQPNLSQRIFNTHSHIPLSSIPKLELGHYNISPSFLTHPLRRHFQSWPSHHNLSTKIRGFLSQPMIVQQQFALNSRNALQRISARSLLDCRPSLPIVHFSRLSFIFYQNYDFYRRRGWRSWFQRLTPSDMVSGLIVANIAVYILWKIADEEFMIKNFTVSFDNFKSGRLHTLITSSFSHIDFPHLFFNMLGLYFFGMNIGRNFGPEFLLKLYLAGAVGGSVFYFVHQAYEAQTSKGWRFMNPLMGASGALNAVMLLDIFLFPKATLYLEFFLPIPAILFGIFLIWKDMLRMKTGDTRISGSAHLGGAAVAAIAWARVRKGRF